MRTHSEQQLEQIWAKEVVIQEASVFTQFFDNKQLAAHNMHKLLKLSADAMPLEKLDNYTKRGKFKPGIYDQLFNWEQKYKDKKVQGDPKHIEMSDALKTGVGLLIINPESNNRVVMKQVIKNPDASPESRSLEHRGGKGGTKYKIWVFDKDGQLRREGSRSLTGRNEEDPSRGRYTDYSEDDPDARQDYTINKATSNVFVRYVDVHPENEVFVIPNEAFLATPKPYVQGDRPAHSGVKLHNRQANSFKDRATSTAGFVRNVIKRNGLRIKEIIKANIEPIKQSIVSKMDDDNVSPENLQKFMDEYRHMTELDSPKSKFYMLPMMEEFVETVNLNDYGVTASGGLYFAAEEYANKFVRDFAIFVIQRVKEETKGGENYVDYSLGQDAIEDIF
jgi:hypothetical protein